MLVVSPGGMGSTSLIEQLRAAGLETNCPSDTDGFKHSPDAKKVMAAFNPESVIYGWNQPLLAILSLERRGWLNRQHKKLGGKATFASLE